MKAGNMKTDKNILIAFLLNLSFSIFEFFGGIFTGSVAISSDALHDLGDALSIGLSYILEKISKKKANKKYTYGYIKYSIIGSIITTTILLVGGVLVIYNSVIRIFNPMSINYNGMLIFALIGMIVNIVASYYTKDGDSLNQKSVNLHMLEDVLGWIVVLVASIVMKYTNINIIDPILSIIVSLYIFYNAQKNMKEVLNIFLEKTPKNIDIDQVEEKVLKVKGVLGIHHIHARSIDGYTNFATLHVIVKKYNSNIKHEVKEELEKLGICHSTIELEEENEKCHEELCEMDNKKIIHNHHHH
jgi:cation diffusion facilitator family transporter